MKIETIMGMTVKIRNAREQKLVRICRDQINRIVDQWGTDDGWAKSFETKGASHWKFTDVDGLLTAMFYMDMIETPTASGDVYEYCRREALGVA